ncbi:hypothetical protein XENOCAPTIV_015060, partial [Xenoophorus captivus]
IDCVGILKLRNADIELRNGETDIGRKNTRVRLVFRVHIPEPGGHLVSLQVASHPIECYPRSHTLPPDSLDEPAYYQSRTGNLLNNPVMYHTANQLYSNCSANMLSYPVSAPSPCVSVRTPMAKLAEGPQVGDSFEACLVSRHQGFVPPLGKSPPSRYVQVKTGSQIQPFGQPLTQIGSAKENHDDKAPEKITIKQENLSYAYLEDGEF